MAKKPKSKRTKRKGSLASFPKGMVQRTRARALKETQGMAVESGVDRAKAPEASLLGQTTSALPVGGGPARNPQLAMANWTPDEGAQAKDDSE